MNRVVVVAAIVFTMTVATSWGQGGIARSPHDFSRTNSATYGQWNTRDGICSPCHSAHHSDEAQLVPLWKHATSTGPFVPYSSPQMNAAVGDPDGASLACLSCHDGTLGVNTQIAGGTNVNSGGAAVLIPSTSSKKIGPDLHTTHPISFLYNTALATADGALEDPSTYKIGDAKTRLTHTTAPVPSNGWTGVSLTGKTIAQAMLIDGKMQCSSCHDVHKQEGSAPTSSILLKVSGSDVSGRGSLICRTCHVK